MYIPKHYQNSDLKEIIRHIKENGFAVIVNHLNGNLHAAHIPLEAEGTEDSFVLHGHIAKANTQSRIFDKNNEVLAIFTGPHAYVSSSWYQKENVSTWDYIAVHVYGKVRILEGDEKIENLRRLTDRYEADMENPEYFDDKSQKLLNDHLPYLTAFEITPTKIEAANKLSQNRNAKDYGNIIRNLEQNSGFNSQRIVNELKKKSNQQD